MFIYFIYFDIFIQINVINYYFRYAGDSPPRGWEHIVVFDFFLNFGGEEDQAGGGRKKRKKEGGPKVVPAGYLHEDLRVFVGVLTRSEEKRKNLDLNIDLALANVRLFLSFHF